MIRLGARRRGICCFESALAIPKFRRDFYRPVQRTIQKTSQHHRAIALERPHRLRVNILDKCLRNHAKLDITVDPTERQIVDVAAERRDVVALPRIQFHRQQIVPAEVEMRREFERERGIPAFVFGKLVAIDRHRRGGHRAGEIHEHPLAFPAD